jgi:hypothetical protein
LFIHVSVEVGADVAGAVVEEPVVERLVVS